jgi:WD40 repeat protein
VKPESPYKGLVPFEESDLDALLFFGRERESEIIAANLLAARLTVLYGPSGVGKTSVLRAGVAHRLRRLARANVAERGHPEFAVVVFDVWSEDPAAALRQAVRDELTSLFGSALLDEREGESLADTLARWTEALACDVLLILDQAEEYFLYHAEDSGFAEALPELVTRPALRVRVLLSLREDALAKLDRFKGRIPNLFANYLRLDHLDRHAARDAIVQPVERYNELTGESFEIEPTLVEAVLEQTAAGKVDLGEAGQGTTRDEADEGLIEAPYLQLVMERIWDEERRAGSNRLRLEILKRLGGAESIVRAHLRRAVEDLSSAERDVAADVFRYLVTPSGAKIAHGLGDLAEYTSVDEQRLVPVLSTLRRERIVRPVDGAGADGDRYEIYHDVLADAVLGWRREQELERERRLAAKRQRRLLLIAIGALLAVAAMTAVAIYALAQRGEAQSKSTEAQSKERQARARELAATAVSNLATDPDKSVELAKEAAELEPTAASESVLRSSLIASRVRAVVRPSAAPASAASYSPDGRKAVMGSKDGRVTIFNPRSGKVLATMRHPRAVTAASFSPNGRSVATASNDRTVRVWTPAGRPVRTLRHERPVLDLAFTSDSSTLVTAADGAVTAWSVPSGRSLWVARVTGTVLGISVSPDARYVAAFGMGNVANVYDVGTGRLIGELEHDGRVTSAAFSPGGRLLVTGSSDWTAKVWDLSRGLADYMHQLRGHSGRVLDVAISPRAGLVVTASADQTSRVWELGSGILRAVLVGHSNFVRSAAFSPGGFFIVTSSTDGSARTWKTDGGLPQATLRGHEGSVRGAVYAPGGGKVLTYGEDGTAREWNPETEPLLGLVGRHRAATVDLDVAPRGKLVLASSLDGTARTWRLPRGVVTTFQQGTPETSAFSPDGRLVAATGEGRLWAWTSSGVLRHSQRRVVQAAFSPDSRLLAGVGGTGGRIWMARTGRLVRRLGARVPMQHVAFSPDGLRLATAERSTIRIWLVSNGQLERTLDAPARIEEVSWSPDGRRLLAASAQGTVRLWEPGSGRRVRILRGHTRAITSARFSDQSDLIVTASVDNDARIWDARTGRGLRVLRGHLAVVSDARFSDDGRWVVTAGPGRAGIWEVQTGRLLFFLRGHNGRLTSAAFVHGGHAVVTAGVDGSVRTYTCDVCGGIDELIGFAERRLERISRP